MQKLDRITINPQILNGQPCIRGMRLSVKRVVEAVALLSDWDTVIKEYPDLDTEDIRQALAWAAGSVDDESIDLGVA